ncbi:MAG: pyridoxamine 5'-phosphate oxidase family protein, partial [Rhodospirillales bacterium]|nr:pyridoxamine 5'-phosphate oxidase family protein [Rhodospirillales bacterium]
MRRSGTAALATVAADTGGWPYASLVAVALDQDGAPLLLISRLAEHTSNIGEDSRVSLLFSDLPDDGEDPLTGSRATVVGRAQRSTQPHHKRRFLARHPEAAQYVEFTDFSFFRIEVERTHLVAGFGIIHWIEGRDALIDRKIATAFVEAED